MFLIAIIAVLAYTVFTDQGPVDLEYNIKRGVCVGIFMFLAIGITHGKNGPFKRPHPVLWRLAFCSSILYEISILFLLFQSAEHGRLYLAYLDPELNKPLDFRSYGGNCTIWDSENENQPLHIVMDKMDGFLVAHFISYFLKTLIFRDVSITLISSAAFELMEYTLEHHVPNFSECWWDHWILDFLLCNGLGIYFGQKCLKFLSAKGYKWKASNHIDTYRGKIRCVVEQFSPYRWEKFHWKPTENLFRWLSVTSLILMVLVSDLNTFYLNFVLWMSPNHHFALTRLAFIPLWASVAVREIYDYIEGITDRFGQQAWMVVMIIATEFMLNVKYGWDVVTLPFPFYIKVFWGCALAVFICGTAWKFTIRFPKLKEKIHENSPRSLSCYTNEVSSNDKFTSYDNENRIRKRIIVDHLNYKTSRTAL